MKNNKFRGAITVYLSIILSAVIMLSGILIDIVRIRAAELQIRRAANTASASALAGYDAKLKEDYGLFALHNSDRAYLKEEVEFYLTNQLITKEMILDKKRQVIAYPSSFYTNNKFNQVKFIDLYDYRIESIETVPLYNFTENEITRQQIAEYMKYRAPIQLTESFIEKINNVAKTEELSSAYKQKTMIEKKLSKIEKALNKLQEHIDQINSFEKESFDRSPDSESKLIKLIKNTILKSIYSKLKGADPGIPENKEEKEKASALKERVDELYDSAKMQAENSIDFFDELLAKQLKAVNGALQEIGNIKELSAQVRLDIKNFKAYLKNLNQEETTKKENSNMLKALQYDIEKYEKLIDSESSQSLFDDLNKNLEILKSLQMNISKLPEWIAAESSQISSSSLNSFESSLKEDNNGDFVDQQLFNELLKKLASDIKTKSIDETANSYNILNNILNKSKAVKGKDPRKSTAEAANKTIKEIEEAVAKPKIIENPKLLPSYFINESYPNKIFSEDAAAITAPDYAESKVAEDYSADFDEDSSFIDESFDYIVDFSKTLKSKALKMRDEIYVNEYILKIFRDAVEISTSNTDGKSNSAFFEKGEVEYIIGGNANEKVNYFIVKGQILLIRSGMNTLHVYSDSQKRLQALEIATALAGVTGFGIPVIQNLLMFAWGTAEALYDIKDIYSGKKVPFIKTAYNWRTDLLPSGFKENKASKSEAGLMDFDYHDYLRLLLLAKDNEVKMNRIEDLIQLNVQQSKPEFKLSGGNTYIKVNASVSIKYWFITKLFVPSKYKTSDGDRHIINVEIWRGY